MESAADAKVNYSEMNEVCFFAQSFFKLILFDSLQRRPINRSPLMLP